MLNFETYVTGLAVPVQYMGGFPGMYIPSSFNQAAMYGTSSMMIPNMILPHAFLQQNTCPVTSISNNLNANDQQTEETDCNDANALPTERVRDYYCLSCHINCD